MNPLKLHPSALYSRAIGAGFAVLAFLAVAMHPSSAQPVLSLQPETGERSGFFLLSWETAADFVYRVQKSHSLGSATQWDSVDAVRGDAGQAQVEVKGGSPAEFYRLAAGPEIMGIEPAWIDSSDPESVLYILGQLLPDDATVIINGQTFAPTIVNSDGVWAKVSLNGLPQGPLTGAVVVVNGAVPENYTYKLQSGFIYATQPSARLLQGPPDFPPTAPTPVFGKKLYVGNLPFSYDEGGSHKLFSVTGQPSPVGEASAGDNYKLFSVTGQPSPVGEARSGEYKLQSGFIYATAPASSGRLVGKTDRKSGSIILQDREHNEVARLSAATGELLCEETDLLIPGRGLDIVWTRTYRSRTGPNTTQGHGWDFSYNVSLTQHSDGTVEICMGNGRCDTFYPNGTNGWARDEYFVEVRDLDGDGMPDVLFADGGKWLFNPATGVPGSGRLSHIVDRNGNTISLQYNAQDRCETIVDTLGRTIAIAYNTAGQIASLTDFAGRVVRYEYDSNGDLTACVSPAVIGTPNGNDFPEGKTNRYFYSSGFADERLNHNLVVCVDARDQARFQVQYHPTDDPASLDFDAVASVRRGIDKKDIRRGMVIAKPSNSFAVTHAIVNDYAGNVTEYFFDSRQRCVRQLEFTGRADPRLPTNSTENRPKDKLRADDPDFYETLWTWNADSLCTREMLPGRETTVSIYQRDFETDTNPRKKGDLRVLRQVAVAGGDLDGDGVPDFTERSWHFEYDPRFGSPAIAAGKMGYDKYNEVASARYQFPGDKIPIVKGSALRVDHAINTKGTGAAGRTRINELENRLQNLGIIARMAPRDKEKPFLMPVDDVFMISVRDPRGNTTTATYDDHGNRTEVKESVSLELGFSAKRFSYNAHGQLIAITNAPDANGRCRVDTFEYYEDPTDTGYGFLHRATRDNHLQGAADVGQALWTTFEYDPRGNVIRIIDPRTNDWLFTYNALNQCVRSETPTNLTARCATDYFYDANNNLVQCTSELRDETDAPAGADHVLFEYDSLNRLVSLAEQASPGTFLTNRFFYDANGNLAAVHSPLAVGGIDPANIITNLHDERNFRWRQVSGPFSPSQSTTEFSYDKSGRERSRVRAIEDSAPAISIRTYDGFGRPSTFIDPMGNVTIYGYDRNDNLVFARVNAETNDVPGSAGNLRYHEWRWRYDALNRCIESRGALFNPATQLPIGGGVALTRFAYAPNGQLVSVTDPNGNLTTCAYDTVGRLASVTDAKTNVVSFAHDRSGNVVGVTQSERSDLTPALQEFTASHTYDTLHRLTQSVDNAGNTNRFAYDSRGNLISHLNPREHETFHVYDGLNRRVTTINYQGKDRGITINTSHVEYDVRSRIVAVTDSNTNTTTYAYDSLDRCVGITNADGTTHKLIWSPRTNLIGEEDANGTVISNSFDLLDRCIRRDVAPGAGVAASTTFEIFAYDGLSRCVLASNDVSRAEFAYDSLGNAARQIQDGWQMLSAFDANGNRLSLHYPSGLAVGYNYNALNQVTSVARCEGCANPWLGDVAAALAYDGPDRLARIARPNGVNTRINWNGLVNPPNAQGDFGWKQVSRVNHQRAMGGTFVDNRAFAYDRNQNKTIRGQLNPFFAGGETTTNLFGYDAVDRLQQSARRRGSPQDELRSYALDGNGNRQSVTLIQDGLISVDAYIMDDTLPDPADFQMNQYTMTPFGSHEYDLRGNRIVTLPPSGTDPTLYVYDFADRLVEVWRTGFSGTPELVASYAYDALDRRISKTVHSGATGEAVTTRFAYDGGRIIESRQSGVLVDSYIHNEDDGVPLMAISAGGEVRYYLTDELGSVLALTDAAGNVLERYDYDDFGEPHFLNADGQTLAGSDGLPATASAWGNPFLFHGMEWDSETGLYFGHSQGGTTGPIDAKEGRGLCAKVTIRIQQEMVLSRVASANNPWTLKKEEGGRHTPFHNKRESASSRIIRNVGKHKGDYLPAHNFKIEIDGVISDGGGNSTPGIFRKLLDRGQAGDPVDQLRAVSSLQQSRHDTAKGAIRNMR